MTDARDAIVSVGAKLRSLRLRGESFATRCAGPDGSPSPLVDTVVGACPDLREISISWQCMVSAAALLSFPALECLVVQPHRDDDYAELAQTVAWTLALSELAARPRFRRLHFLEATFAVEGISELLQVRRPALLL